MCELLNLERHNGSRISSTKKMEHGKAQHTRRVPARHTFTDATKGGITLKRRTFRQTVALHTTHSVRSGSSCIHPVPFSDAQVEDDEASTL